MTAVTHQFIDRAGAVTEIEVKCAGELAHEVIYLGRTYRLTGRTVVSGRVRRLTYVEASAPGKPKEQHR